MGKKKKLTNENVAEKQGARRGSTKQIFGFEPLDKSSFVPMYFQIQTQLLTQIRSGRLKAGDLLPSEDELSRVYGVSRMTTRQSLQALKRQGFAHSYKGRGTFVLQPKAEKRIAHLCGFTAEMLSLGMKPTTRILKRATISATPELATKLAILHGSPVLELRRLRLADAVPMAIERVWLSLGAFPGIEKIDFSRNSLYETLRKRYGIVVASADEIVEARGPTRSEAKLLEISSRASLLVIDRTIKTSDGNPVEASVSLYRSDRYRAVLTVPAATVE